MDPSHQVRTAAGREPDDSHETWTRFPAEKGRLKLVIRTLRGRTVGNQRRKVRTREIAFGCPTGSNLCQLLESSFPLEITCSRKYCTHDFDQLCVSHSAAFLNPGIRSPSCIVCPGNPFVRGFVSQETQNTATPAINSRFVISTRIETDCMRCTLRTPTPERDQTVLDKLFSGNRFISKVNCLLLAQRFID